ncbi:MAG TPA: hypothetical protein PLB27_11295 [Bacteroidales bacterium]|nr:hypothetical protein [Bacteroidales bacterium]HOX75293.1 hypothetical protein [Bacteroidales bacterium]
MKKILLHISLIAVFTAFAFDASCQKSAFSGTWKLDRTKSVLPEYISVLTQITVKMKADSILTERYYDVGDGQEYPFDENLPLNGSNVSITIYDMPRKTNVTFSDMDNTVSLTSTTTFYDSGTPIDFNSKET